MECNDGLVWERVVVVGRRGSRGEGWVVGTSKFWPFAYSQAVYTRNLTYIKKYDAAPISSLYQTEGYPTKQLQALRKFGSIAYVYVPREHRKIFNSRAKAGIYVGNCPITGAWLIYFREDNAVIRTISAKFDDDSVAPSGSHTSDSTASSSSSSLHVIKPYE